MTDGKTVTGNRDDLLVDASRCLRMRFSESSCQRCLKVCPHGAVNLDGGLAMHSDQCHGCLLCTAVCPVGAIEQNNDFNVILAQLAQVSGPVLGCCRTREQANSTLSCLGGLSAEHLLLLCYSLPGVLTLNLTACSNCCNNGMIPCLQQRLENLSVAGLLDGGCRIVIAERADDICYQVETVDRRSFFKSFRNSLFKSAADILVTTTIKTGQRSAYGGKRLPRRREYLNRARTKVSAELEDRIRKRFDALVLIEGSCTNCQGCVAICPTGALLSNGDESSPEFDRILCTGCGLCVEFCLDGAVRMQPEE